MSRNRKPRKVLRVKLTPEQFAALRQYQKDMQQARPLMQETASAARRIWEETKNAETVQIAETQMPDGRKPPEVKPWTVGHAQVNYVDKIGQTPK